MDRRQARQNRAISDIVFCNNVCSYFLGDVNIQRFVMNIWQLNAEQTQLATETAKLNTLNRHIELLQGYSADYVEELGLKYLNIGDPDIKILKI